MATTRWDTPTKVTAAVVQMAMTPEPQKNVEKATSFVAEAAARGANIVMLPELFNLLYPCQKEDHTQFAMAEPIPGPTSDALCELAREKKVVIVASLFERRGAGIYHNTAVVIESDGTLLGKYRKMHIPDDPCYYEKFYFTPGDLGFRVFATRFGRIGVGVCWDQWFPETARLLALAGAELIVFPTAIGWLKHEKEHFGKTQLDAWCTVIRAHGIANGVFVAVPNRVGTEGEIQFWGNSFICDPNGQLLGKADSESEGVVLAECNFEAIDVIRTHWPFLRDRRVDAYEGLLKRFLVD